MNDELPVQRLLVHAAKDCVMHHTFLALIAHL